MYIDFHVHAFADNIAERAISQLLANSAEFGFVPSTDGTVSDLRRMLKEKNISKAVLLPIATKPSQQTIINNWAISVKDDFFYPFGTVHPQAEDRFNELQRIKDSGLYGIKLHPDYQDFFVDDDKMIPLYKQCAQLGLPVLIHAGIDPLSPQLVHCTPQAAARVFDAVPEMTLILAHGGGMLRWNDVEKYLAGKKGNLYFDISAISGYISHDQLSRIVKKHGADKILFGSDSPWSDPVNEINMVDSLDLTDEEKDMIFYKNAMDILHIIET